MTFTKAKRGPRYIPERGYRYAEYVPVIRQSVAEKHVYLDITSGLAPADAISVLSIADDSKDQGELAETWRMILRLAAYRRHTQVILGIFGVGTWQQDSQNGNPFFQRR